MAPRIARNWTFTNIPNGLYAVMTTWTAVPGQATNATYRIYDTAFATTDAVVAADRFCAGDQQPTTNSPSR